MISTGKTRMMRGHCQDTNCQWLAANVPKSSGMASNAQIVDVTLPAQISMPPWQPIPSMLWQAGILSWRYIVLNHTGVQVHEVYHFGSMRLCCFGGFTISLRQFERKIMLYHDMLVLYHFLERNTSIKLRIRQQSVAQFQNLSAFRLQLLINQGQVFC